MFTFEIIQITCKFYKQITLYSNQICRKVVTYNILTCRYKSQVEQVPSDLPWFGLVYSFPVACTNDIIVTLPFNCPYSPKKEKIRTIKEKHRVLFSITVPNKITKSLQRHFVLLVIIIISSLSSHYPTTNKKAKSINAKG